MIMRETLAVTYYFYPFSHHGGMISQATEVKVEGWDEQLGKRF